MKDRKRIAPILAWLLAGTGILAGLIQVVEMIAFGPASNAGSLLETVTDGLLYPLFYGGLGALIVSRQPRNTVGWLMLISAQDPTGLFSPFVGSLDSAPEVLTPAMWLYIWFANWSWILFIFPIFLIPLYFPNGRLPSPRWKWVNGLAIFLGLSFAILMILVNRFGPEDASWTVANPVGFIPSTFFGETFFLLWGIGLMTIVGGSVASLFVRFRRAGPTERDQIKWLLFAGIFFFVAYGVTYSVANAATAETWSGPVFGVGILILPVAISIAILRHRLYDINLIIRRAFQYSLISGFLALVYFGAVVTWQWVLTSLFGVQTGSTLITVVSTLAIAAMFNPLRRTTQQWIDRRFFRAKYDAEQVLAGFARAARDEVDLDRLAGSLLDVVGQTVRPVQTSLWLRGGRGR